MVESRDFFGPEYYVPIPQGIRFSENTINLGDGAEAGNFTLSQGVTTVPDENELPVIDSVTGSAPNPGESSVYDDATGTIVWIQDTDAQMVEGVPITPGFPPFIDIDKSAGVLSFNVTLPDSAEGKVDVISGISMTWNTHRYKVTPGEFTWDEEPIEVLNGALEGCSIYYAANGASVSSPKKVPVNSPLALVILIGLMGLVALRARRSFS